ncbi:3-oxoacyl-ACP synthase OS=Streptomyces microflavus OX=1919 GN=fabH_2 PE=4 SV=1 [Streptomyces microflavus]
MDEIDWVVPHPGTGQLHTAVRERLDIPEERFVTNYETRANTGSASVPIVLSEMSREGRLGPGTSATRPRWAGLYCGGLLFRV